MSDWGSFAKGLDLPSLTESVVYALYNRDQRHARLKAEEEAKTKEEEAKAEEEATQKELMDMLKMYIGGVDSQVGTSFMGPGGGLEGGMSTRPGMPEPYGESGTPIMQNREATPGDLRNQLGGMGYDSMTRALSMMPREAFRDAEPEPEKEDTLEQDQLKLLLSLIQQPLMSGATEMPDWRAQLESYNMDPSDFETEYNYIRDNPASIMPPEESPLDRPYQFGAGGGTLLMPDGSIVQIPAFETSGGGRSGGGGSRGGGGADAGEVESIEQIPVEIYRQLRTEIVGESVKGIVGETTEPNPYGMSPTQINAAIVRVYNEMSPEERAALSGGGGGEGTGGGDEESGYPGPSKQEEIINQMLALSDEGKTKDEIIEIINASKMPQSYKDWAISTLNKVTLQ